MKKNSSQKQSPQNKSTSSSGKNVGASSRQGFRPAEGRHDATTWKKYQGKETLWKPKRKETTNKKTEMQTIVFSNVCFVEQLWAKYVPKVLTFWQSSQDSHPRITPIGKSGFEVAVWNQEKMVPISARNTYEPYWRSLTISKESPFNVFLGNFTIAASLSLSLSQEDFYIPWKVQCGNQCAR